MTDDVYLYATGVPGPAHITPTSLLGHLGMAAATAAETGRMLTKVLNMKHGLADNRQGI